jgi:autotransporter-associated beta strand protein
LLIAAGLLLLLTLSRSGAATYYLATTGTDTNAGDINHPLGTIMGAQAAAKSGDTILIESGTYEVQPVFAALESGVYEVVNLINKSGVTYQAVPGTRPVFNFSNVNPSGLRSVAFWVTAANVTFQGFDVTGVQENITTSNNQSLAFAEWGCSNCKWLQCNAYSNEGVGFYLEEDSPNNLIYQCDSYNNYGINSFSYGNADGFGCHPAAGGTNNVLRQCRSWNNSDDGYDTIGAHESVTFDHCWSYMNGNNGGNGNGFKVGGWGSTAQDQIANPLPVHTVVYCLSSDNAGNGGYYSNHQPGQAANWWHNTSYGNVTNYNMLERTPPLYSSTTIETDSNDIPGVNENMHYNMGYGATYTNLGNYNEPANLVTNNSWTENITLSSTDFQSTVESQMTGPRQADGSLPVITFAEPVKGSPAAGLGCFAPPSALIWTGSTNSTWNIGSTNWINTTGTGDVFCDGVPVTFPDAAVTGTITIGTSPSPGNVIFSSTSLNYVVQSTGTGIAGGASITKIAPGEVLMTGSESYTGGTFIEGGIYALGADSATTSGTVESPGLTGGTCASLGNASGAVSVTGGGELRLGGRGGTTVSTYILPNPVTLDGGEIVSVDGLQELAGGLTVNAGGADLLTTSTTKNFYIHSAWSGSGPVVIDDIQTTVSSTSGALVLVDTASNPYSGTITIDGTSGGYLGGILEIGNDTALANATIINNNRSVTGLLFTDTSPQVGALSGSGNITMPSSTLTVGGNGASTSYTGNLSGAGGLTKSGNGTMILGGSYTYTGPTTVAGGRLEITGSLGNTSSISVATGAELYINSGTLRTAGSITNAGLIKLSGAALLSSTSTFTNNNVLDVINGPQTLPANLVNNGVILSANSVKVNSVVLTGSNQVSVTVQGYADHTYQLQRAGSLQAPITWTNVGASVTGTGGAILFTDGGAPAGSGFYKVVVSP